MTEKAKKFLAHCCDDYTDLALLVDLIREEDAKISNVGLRKLALSILSELVEKGFIIAGDFMAPEPKVWSMTSAEVTKKIAEQWREGIPHAGDIVWFQATHKGHNYCAK